MRLPRVSFVKLANMPSCIRAEVWLALDQRISCSDCCGKNVLWLTQMFFSRILYCIQALP